MAGRNEKPGFVEGVSKEFFGVPRSGVLTRQEQQLKEGVRANELAGRSLTELQSLRSDQGRANLAADRTLQEIAETRELVSDTIAPLLREGILTNLAIDGRLEDLQGALEAGLSETHDAIEGVGEGITGISTPRRSVSELINSGRLDEVEAILLAANHVLGTEQAKDLQINLAPWKRRIIFSGLVSNFDPEREKTLSAEELVFLADLRRKKSIPIESFRSLELAARYRLIDPDVHHALAKELRTVRFGTEGINYGVQELTRQGDVSIHNQEIVVKQNETAVRLARAGVIQRKELTGLARESVGIQADTLDFARRAEVDRQEMLQNTSVMARNSELGLLLAQRREQQQAIMIGEMEKLGASVGHFGAVQSRQMDVAQATRVDQLRMAEAMLAIGQRGNVLLADVNTNLETLQEIGGMQVQELEGINQGISVLGRIATAQLNSSLRVEGGLDRLAAVFSAESRNVANVIDLVRLTIMAVEGRTIERDRSRDQISADETFREAMTMLKIGKIDDAVECFTKSIAKWRADFRAYLQRGLCYISKDEAGKAESDFRYAIGLTPDDEKRTRSVIRLNLARLYYSESKIRYVRGENPERDEGMLKAIEEAKAAVLDDPDYLESHFALAVYLAAFSLYEEARKVLMDVIQKDPRYVAKIKFFDEFKPLYASLKNTLKEDFDDDDTDLDLATLKAHLSLAKDCIEVGDKQTALKLFQYLLDKNPKFLFEQRVWEIEQFVGLKSDIETLLLEIGESAQKKESEYVYNLVAVMLHYSGISKLKIYALAEWAIKADPDYCKKRAAALCAKLVKLWGGKGGILFSLLRTRYPGELKDWFLNHL